MQKKRKFVLQAVLDYRRHVEESALVVVAECRRRCDAYIRQYERCEAAIEDLARSIHCSAAVRLDNARVCELLSAHLRRVVQSSAAPALHARGDLDEACRLATAAARSRRALEMLSERHEAAVAAADLRAEEAEIEEFNAVRPGLRLAGWR